MTQRSRPVILHPFLFALYPILSLISLNLNEIRLSETYRSLVIGLAIAVVLVLIFRVASRTWELAALATSFFLILFFSYGHIFLLLNSSGEVVVRHRYILLVLALLFAVVLTVAVRYRNRLSGVAVLLNWISVVAIAIPLTGIVSFGFRRATMPTVGVFNVISDWGGLPSVDIADAPDIYYIVLDEYADTDHLSRDFNYDNSAFEESLTENDFFLADES